MLRYDKTPEELAKDIVSIMQQGKLIQDVRPQEERKEMPSQEPKEKAYRPATKKVSGPKL